MSLEPAKAKLSIWRGATFRKRLFLYDVDEELRDLTDHTALLEVRDEPSGDVLLTLSTENDRIELGGAAGTIDLVIAATDTADILWEAAVYDLTLTAPDDGDTDALLWGHVTVRGI